MDTAVDDDRKDKVLKCMDQEKKKAIHDTIIFASTGGGGVYVEKHDS